MTLKKTIVIFGLGIAGGQAFAGNLLTNPGFEGGNMTGWTTTNFTATNNDFHTGSWSSIGSGNVSLEQSFTPVASTSVTEVSVWAKQPNLTNFFFAFQLLYSDATSTQVLGSGGTGNVWTKFNFTSSLNLTKNLSGIRAFGYSTGGTSDITFYDDFVVNSTVPEPASFAVLGLGALALLRRKKK